MFPIPGKTANIVIGKPCTNKKFPADSLVSFFTIIEKIKRATRKFYWFVFLKILEGIHN